MSSSERSFNDIFEGLLNINYQSPTKNPFENRQQQTRNNIKQELYPSFSLRDKKEDAANSIFQNRNKQAPPPKQTSIYDYCNQNRSDPLNPYKVINKQGSSSEFVACKAVADHNKDNQPNGKSESSMPKSSDYVFDSLVRKVDGNDNYVRPNGTNSTSFMTGLSGSSQHNSANKSKKESQNKDEGLWEQMNRDSTKVI